MYNYLRREPTETKVVGYTSPFINFKRRYVAIYALLVYKPVLDEDYVNEDYCNYFIKYTFIARRSIYIYLYWMNDKQ